MPKGTGHINAGRVDKSPRLMRIVEILKTADYPPSAKEITVQAYDFGGSGELMLNVSTNIGEIRAQVNQDAGYVVSFATRWQVVPPGHELGMKHNKDDSITFHIEKATAPWHDGRPRYWLQAAPGWTPRWVVGEDGELRRRTGASCQSPVAGNPHPGPRTLDPGNSPSHPGPRTPETGPRFCQRQKCGKELDQDNLGAFCNGDCRKMFWVDIVGEKEEETAQTKLF